MIAPALDAPPIRRRRQWFWLPLLLVLAITGWVMAGSYLTQRSPAPVRSGPFELSVWFPPEGCVTVLQPASVQPGYLALFVAADSASPAHQLDIFRLGGAEPVLDSSIALSMSNPLPIRQLWPDGRALRQQRSSAAHSRQLRYDLLNLHDDPAGTQVLAQFDIPHGMDTGPAALRGDALFYFERLKPPGGAGQTTGMQVWSQAAGQSPQELALFTDIHSHGWAWADGELTLAALLNDGRVQVLSGEPPRFRDKPELAVMGQAALSAGHLHRSFYLAQDFGMFETVSGKLCIAQGGQQLQLTERDPIDENPQGKPRGLVWELRQEAYLRGLLPESYVSLDKLLEFTAREGRTAPADVYSRHETVSLADENTIVIGDRDYHRLNIIRCKP